MPPKNPFAKPKATTIRRDGKEVYKGLNVPDYTPTTPLDKLFVDLERKLAPQADVAATCRAFAVDTQYQLVSTLLDTLKQIQTFAIEEKPRAPDGNQHLIAIAMHDLKTFSKVVNAIIIYGVYPALSRYRIGIPFAKRNLSRFSKIKDIEPLPTDAEAGAMLMLIYTKLAAILEVDGDVRDLLLRGTGFSDLLVVTIALITTPALEQYAPQVDYDRVVHIGETYELYQTFTLLVSTPSPPYFKQFVFKKLQRLPYDFANGVKTLVEFVLGLRESTEVKVDKFDHVVQAIMSKPQDISSVDYYTNIITRQCYDLLVNINRPTITSCIVYVLDKLWQRNSRIITDFLFKKIWYRFNPDLNPNTPDTSVIVDEADLNNNLNVLISLSKQGADPEFLQAGFAPMIVPLWGYLMTLKQRSKPVGVVTDLLVSYFTTASETSTTNLDAIAQHLTFDGTDNWYFSWGPNGLTQIRKRVEPLEQDPHKKIQSFVNAVDRGCSEFITLLDAIGDEALITSEFLVILKRWIKLSGASDTDPFLALIDLKLLEAIGEKFGSALCEKPQEMLTVVQTLLEKPQATHSITAASEAMDVDEGDSDDEDDGDETSVSPDTVVMVLQLLSAILSENNTFDSQSLDLLKQIKSTLETEEYKSLPAAQSLVDRIDEIISGGSVQDSPLSDQEKVLKKAISSLNDPLVPIRAHGLYLLRQLIEKKSSVIDISFTVNLHLIQLSDPEPFVYLNTIKGLEALIDLDPQPVLSELCQLYAPTAKVTSAEENDVDQRLRIGEVLLRYVQSAGEMFANDASKLVVSTALRVVETPQEDSRLRMSAMSILGICCYTNPIGFLGLVGDALDAALQVLQVDKGKDLAIVRRAACVMIHDLIMGTTSSAAVPFPREYMQKVYDALKYTATTDDDLLAREQAQRVIDTIEEVSQDAWSELQQQERDKYGILKIT
ncbi:hypothetical protein DIURU_000260 [Diutina rugosa]|uniref:RNA polymerase II assembly factor Rtp1 C-terminal domain-containing protein n=1 Tax=Diutina rugosa TaxID=5481 RepID=A0A642UZ87_DIURU|nr:uncharacterized protein DIURU_000260 [Diutina rugosa]KAA8908291.1 hypothetical protein DIURU_000260 [Diutina rugosa]